LPADIRKWIWIGADGFNDFIDWNDDKVMFANMWEVFEWINLPFTVDFSDKSIQESFAKLMEKIDSISWVEAKDKKTLLAVFKWEWSKELLDKVAPFSASVAALFSNRDMTEAKFLGAIKDPTVMVAEYKKDEDTINA
jgi:hypothetical protein